MIRFTSGDGRSLGHVYCFSELTNVEGEARCACVRSERDVLRIEPAVGAAHRRTWSAERIPSAVKGPWRVEVRDATRGAIPTFPLRAEWGLGGTCLTPPPDPAVACAREG